MVLAWGSQSMRRVGRPSRARAAARLMAVVVLPTPPFWLTTAMTLPGGVEARGAAEARASFEAASGVPFEVVEIEVGEVEAAGTGAGSPD